MFDNDVALNAAIMQDLISIVDVVTDKLHEELKKLIKKIVYDPYTPREYNRQGNNGGLLDEWDKKDPVVAGNVVYAEIFEDPARLNVDPATFVHGSNFWIMSDIRQLLAEIVIEGKSGSLFDFGQPPHFWKSPRNFWIVFVKLLGDGTVDRMIEMEMKKKGIPFIKL